MTRLVEHMRNEQRDVMLTIEGDKAAFSQQTQLALYHAVQEGLTNVQKHANATQVVVDLRYHDDEAALSMRDNGCGFDTAILQQLPSEREGGYGLLGLQERLQLVGGHLHIESSPGEGTNLLVHVPKLQYSSLKKDRERGTEQSVCHTI
jgi:signal transduction histidine kinase